MTVKRIASVIVVAAFAIAGATAQDDFDRDTEPVFNPTSDAAVRLAVLPTYPRRALRHRIDGEVTVKFKISRFGRAIDPEVIRESPKKVFRSETLDALKYWYFIPARSGMCTTIEQVAVQTFLFRAGDEKQVQVPPIVIEGLQTSPRSELRVAAFGGLVGGEGQTSEVTDTHRLAVTRRVEPEYPEKALGRRREGFVAVSFMIEKDGTVSEPRVIEANNGALFKGAALRAIKRWTFEPAYRNGAPVERMGCHEFMFNLDAHNEAREAEKIFERTRNEVL